MNKPTNKLNGLTLQRNLKKLTNKIQRTNPANKTSEQNKRIKQANKTSKQNNLDKTNKAIQVKQTEH